MMPARDHEQLLWLGRGREQLPSERYRYDLVAIAVSDPREEELPDVGLIGVRDPETGEAGVIDTGSRRVRQAYAENARMTRELLRDTVRRSGVDLLELSTGEDYDRHLVRFFRERARRVSRAGH